MITVLVVEDDDLFRELTVKLLRRPDRDVLAARGSAQAMIEARAHGFAIDLLVTDVVMHEGDGLALARRLAGRHPALKVLFMSGYGPEAMTAAFRAPNRSFLEKPFTPATFARAIDDLLDASS
jgi:DNA-binding NtrC family response regulator